jgi:NADH-quinone oxidoreductase subunit D
MSKEYDREFEKKFQETTRLGLEVVKESEEDRLMTLSVGPQHPGSGHFRFTIKVDGDYIV